MASTLAAAPPGRPRRPLPALGRRLLLAGLAAPLAGLAIAALYRLAHDIHPAAVVAALKALQPWRIEAAIALTALSYAALSLYDAIALRIIGRRLPWRTSALASFTSYALGHNLGLSLITGGSARLRIYTGAGLSAADVGRVVALAAFAFWGGALAAAALVLATAPPALNFGSATLPTWAPRAAGLAILAGAALLLPLARRKGSLTLLGWKLPLPHPGQALAQLAVSLIDLTAAAGALFLLVPGLAWSAFPFFLLVFVVACAAVLVSHVPGGVGVFEATFLAALPGPGAPLLAALIAFRAIYYLAPLALALLLLAASEARRQGGPVAAALGRARKVASALAPTTVSLLVFLGGIVLLVSDALPALPDRVSALAALLPLPFIEASHFAASLVGTALLLLAPGLYRRLDGAFLLTRALLVAGALFSLGKGLDFEEATVLILLVGLLQWTRPAFYRRTALTSEPLSLRWIVTIVAALGLATWIGFVTYKHVAYSGDLWWRFAARADASRFLRASVGAAVLLAGHLLWRLLAPGGRERRPETLPSAVADSALAACERSEAMLAFAGDKCFLVSEAGDAFLMYRVKGRSWIVMGEPVGPRAAWQELLWTIRARADAAQGRLLLYQIGAEALGLAIEMGLQIVKYGEEARVDLASFSVDRPGMRPLRHCVRRAERDGAAFEIVPAADVPALIEELRAVSDAWLAGKGGREKGFSLGRFDADYLRRFDLALVRREGRIVAFANLWAVPNKAEISVDLMRHLSPLPYGTMDLLFAHLMSWAREQGYRRFSLGLAPLSGIESRRLSPGWAKAAAFIFRHGERFYGFEGVRAYKEKFRPEWAPRYIAGPRGLGMFRALIDLQRLIGSRGLHRNRGRGTTPISSPQRPSGYPHSPLVQKST